MENEIYGTGTSAGNVRDRVSDLGNKAAEVGSRAADTAKSKVAAIGEGIENAASTAREKFGDTVEYFREQGFKGVGDDVTKYVKSHPVQALVAALALGFVAGQLLRRD